MNKHSLSFSLSAWCAGLIGLFFIVFGFVVYIGLSRYLVQTVRQSLVADANAIGKIVQDADTKGEDYVVRKFKTDYLPEPEDRFVRVLRGDGSILYQSSLAKYGGFDAHRMPLRQQRDGRSYSSEVYLADHHRLLVEGISVNTRSGSSYLVEAGSLYLYIEGVLAGVLTTISIGVALFMGVGIAGSWILTKRALRPVDRITKLAEHITSSSLSERLPVIRTGDELERLSLSLNKMISRLEGAFGHVNRFSADVSHELRTPLTILRGELEGMAQQPRVASHLMDSISSALDETERLTRIVDHLLTLARLDSDAVVNKAVIRLNELVDTTTEQMKPLAEEKHIAIEISASEPVEIEGDSVRIAQVTANLLDNAIKYTTAGGLIRVSVTSKNNLALLQVADNGIGIPAEALSHVFERFFRADKSRTRSSGGAGLGLAIVKAICTAHKGQVTIASVEDIGTRITVALPKFQPSNADLRTELAGTAVLDQQ